MGSAAWFKWPKRCCFATKDNDATEAGQIDLEVAEAKGAQTFNCAPTRYGECRPFGRFVKSELGLKDWPARAFSNAISKIRYGMILTPGSDWFIF
jgi:hypothetical protein